ncbi:hypothetical protein [Mycoplasmopsis lipofaciens]|uniref:hypothetical protein n=1 Tax=Mycoplasmopsis lipofaciens TaxID=114884 RepID=UPI0004882AE3|nr:hypothetical protein [Mycoplasmopsis lipofaciens]
MKNIIQNLATAFDMTIEEVESKLKLKENYTSKDFAKSLGAYSVFPTKEEHGNYISEKLANKEEMIFQNEKTILELNEKIKNAELAQNQIKNLINTEWKKLGIKRPIEKEQIDFQNLDFGNLTKSLIDYAEREGFSYQKPDFNTFANEKKNTEITNNENIDAISVNGAVKK